MIVEKISMVDALNIETKELMDSYQQLLENMSKEELISEIGRLLVDKGLLLNSRDGYINELKEDNNRLNGLVADGTEVMDYWQDKYLEEKSKNDELQKQVEQLLEECVNKNKNYLQECEEHLKTVQIVKELQEQVDELTEENANLKQGKAIMLDGITDLNRLVQFPVEYDGKNFDDIAELGNYIQKQAVKDNVEEFATKLENRLDSVDIILHEDNGDKYLSFSEVLELIDKICKEMVEAE